MKCALKKANGILLPADQETADFLEKKKEGAILLGEFAQTRNPEFHKKFFSMLNFGYEQFNPVVKYNGVTLRKNKKQFRKDVIIAAGYYRTTFNLKGEPVVHAKSISFPSMKQETFEKLYSSVIDVLLEKVLVNMSREEAEKAAEHLIGYV